VVLHDGEVSGELSGDQLTSAQLLNALAGGTPSDDGTPSTRTPDTGTPNTGTAAGAGRSDRG
jgi:hypothetical protein